MEARSDILWWTSFIEHWNGLSMMLESRRNNPDFVITSDASGSWGCGAYTLTSWFQYQWPPTIADEHITVKELLPIVIAVAIWGVNWANKSILCRCDNEAVVYIINSGTSRDPKVMALIRCLHFIIARHNLLLSATHIAGTENTLADALSRNNLPLFFAHLPQVNRRPSPIPPALIDLLVHSKPDWTSRSWSSMFSTIFMQLSPQTQSVPTPLASDATPTSVHSCEPGLSLPQSPCSVNLSATSLDNISHTKQSSATSLALSSSTSPSPSQTHSFKRCRSSITYSEESSLPKRSHIDSHANGSQ